jgi:muramoyltetrapeptide carboxypeptidase
MLKPKRILQGAHVQIVFPASPVRPDFFEPGMKALRDLGLNVFHDNDVYRKWRYLAGTDEIRSRELWKAVEDPAIEAIFFARGGYGSSRLLTKIPEQINPVSKILLGCSDITSLHLYFQKIHNWVVFHGPMASGDFARGNAHIESLQKALMQSEPYEMSPPGIETLIPGSAEGVLTGGCLTLVDAAIGTKWEPSFDNAILFLEDVGTKPYQIDRMLTHLKILGKLDRVNAFIFGEMKDCIQVENQGYTIQEVLLDLLSEFQKPVYFNFPSGHVSGMSWTLPFGVRARVTPEGGFRLNILEGAVE